MMFFLYKYVVLSYNYIVYESIAGGEKNKKNLVCSIDHNADYYSTTFSILS